MRRVRNLLVFTVAALLLAALVVYTLRDEILRRVGISFEGGTPGQVELTLPAGFRAQVFAEGLMGPRFLAVGPPGTPWAGVLFVAERGRDRVVALPDADHDGHADRVVEVARGLDSPSSLAFASDGALLVAGTTRLTRLVLGPDLAVSAPSTPIDELPGDGQHTTRTVVVAPDGRLFIGIGSSCNVCEEADPRRAAILTAAADGSQPRVFMRGLRNAVGLAFDPRGTLWAVVNGRDFLGDDAPPETLYHVTDGADGGWPRCHAGTIVDPEFGTRPDPLSGRVGCAGVAAPVAVFQAHMAPLGIAFWRDHAVIAFHGSWNRSVKVGYKLMWLPWGADGPNGTAEDLASGWLQADGSVPGRPAGVTAGADGALYVSDDKSGLIYRLSGPGG